MKTNLIYIANAYPSEDKPYLGIFVKNQIDSIKELSNQYNIIIIKCNNGLSSYISALKELRKLNKKKSDIYHFHHGLVYILLRPFLRSDNVFLSFQNELKYEYFKRSKLISTSLSLLTMLFTFIFRDNYIFKGNKSRVFGKKFSIPNGVDTSKFTKLCKKKCKEKLLLEEEKKYLLFISSKSTNRSQKRLDLFLDFMDKINIDDEYYPLILSDVPHDKLVYYYNASECLIVTSDYEGSCNAIKEALACGALVISSNVGDYWRYDKCPLFSYFQRGEISSLLSTFNSLKSKSIKSENCINDLGISIQEVARKILSLYERKL